MDGKYLLLGGSIKKKTFYVLGFGDENVITAALSVDQICGSW